MEVFKSSRRVAPRRIPLVLAHDTVPSPVEEAGALPRVPRRGIVTATVAVAAVAICGVAVQHVFLAPEPAPSPVARRPSPGVSARPSARPASLGPPVVIEAGRGGGGGALGGGTGLSATIVRQNASPDVVHRMREIIVSAKRSPTTRETIHDRLAVFARYFGSLDLTDRKALFGCTDFKHVEKAIQAQGDRAPQALDRCLKAMRLVLF